MFDGYARVQCNTRLTNVIVVGAAQHVWWVLDHHLGHLSDILGYVYFRLSRFLIFRLMFTFYYSEECVLLTIYAHFRGLIVRQHW